MHNVTVYAMQTGIVSTPLVFKILKSLSAMFAHSAHFTHDKRLYGGLTFSNRFFEVFPGWRLERLNCSCVPVNLVEMLLKRPGPCDPGPVAEA